MTRGTVTHSNRYRVTVVTERGRDHPFRLRIVDRLTGERRRETIRDLTSTRAKREAHERAAQKEAELNGGGAAAGPTSWTDARDQALATIAAETRPATLRAYRKVVLVFERYAEAVLTCRPGPGPDGKRLQYVEQVTPTMVRGFPGWRRTHGRTRHGKGPIPVRETTVNRDLKHLLSFWNAYLMKLGLAATNPWKHVRLLRAFRRQPTRLNRRQCDALLHQAGEMGTKLHAAAALAAETGPRVGELSHVTWQHIDTGNGKWLITEEPCGWRPKGVEERLVGFTAETGRLLEEYRSSRVAELVGQGLSAEDARLVVNAGPVFGRGTTADEDPWEREFNADLKKACLLAGVPPITCHGLRYTVGRLAADAGATPWQVQAMLGHAAMATTLHYVGRDKPGAARAAFEALTRNASETICPSGVPQDLDAGLAGDGETDVSPDGYET